MTPHAVINQSNGSRGKPDQRLVKCANPAPPNQLEMAYTSKIGRQGN
jgi:hypothetical protein